MSTAKPTLRARLTRLAIAVTIGIVLAALSAEFALRFFLFHSSSFAREHGRSFRDIGYFGDRQSDEDLWKLEWLMNDSARLHGAPNPDAKHGWLGTIERGTYMHPELSRLAGRRPILLYGDSFAHGNTPREQSFQALVEHSPLAPTHALLNFGVGGYGLDQTWLLLRESIEHYVALDPIVAIGVFVDDDIDRCVLPLRSWPKPRFTLVGGELRDPEPVTTDIGAYLEREPVRFRSYLWGFLKYREGVLPQALQERLRTGGRRIDEKKALARAILTAMHRDLEARHVRHFVLAFLGENALLLDPEDQSENWQERFLETTCKEFGMSLVSTRPYFDAAARGDVDVLRSFFGGSPQLSGHYNCTGNLVAFEALRAGIEERFDVPDFSRVAQVRDVGGEAILPPVEQSMSLFGREVRVRKLRDEDCVRFVEHPTAGGVYARGTDYEPTTISIPLDGASTAFEARLEWAKPRRECDESFAQVVIALDGREVFGEKVEATNSALVVRFDTTGAKTMTITLRSPPAEAECGWVRFIGARFE